MSGWRTAAIWRARCSPRSAPRSCAPTPACSPPCTGPESPANPATRLRVAQVLAGSADYRRSRSVQRTLMSRTPREARRTNDPNAGAWLRAAFPRRRSGDRTPPLVWPAYALLAALALGYVFVELVGIEWAWLDGWGVNGFEIAAGALCVYRAATITR